MLSTTNHGTKLAKTGTGADAAQLTTSYTSGTAVNVRGAAALKVRVYSARGAAATGNTVRILDTSNATNATLDAQEFPVRFTAESSGTAGVSLSMTTDGQVETLLVNLGGAFEEITLQAKSNGGGALDAGDIVIMDVTTVEEVG